MDIFFSYGMKKGFTLIETLVAISILLLAVAGPLTISSRGIASSSFAKQQVIATYLAQEGIEYVRNVRDSNSLAGVSITTGLAYCSAGSSCYVDVPAGTAPVACTGQCPVMTFNSTSGRYGYISTAGWTNTIFRRTINITSVNADEYMVVSTVNWTGGIIPNKTITVREHLFNL